MRCNNCGWENPDGNTKCEKCNAPLQGGGASFQNSGLHSTIRENEPFGASQAPTIGNDTINDSPMSGQPSYVSYGKETPAADMNKTINPWGLYTPAARCTLKPVIFPGEDTRYTPKPVSIKGDFNELNRQILDPDNNTISSKVQAILTNNNGKWYIQNQSSMKTTYVYAGEPVALKSGDMILMGNRTFVFEED